MFGGREMKMDGCRRKKVDVGGRVCERADQ